MQPQFGFFSAQMMRQSTTRASMAMTVVPTRSIHARGYNNFDDHVSMIFNEINFALIHAKNTQNICFIY